MSSKPREATNPFRHSYDSGTGKLHKLLDIELHEKMTNVLKSLMRGGNSKEFLDPVTLPGYQAIILQPMHLNLVRENLGNDQYVPWAEKRYVTAEDFAHDVRLVFKNCFLFNPITHHVFRDGRQKIDKFEKDLEKEYRELERRGPAVSLAVRCQLLLTDLRRNPMTEWFRRAEDWQAYGETYRRAIRSQQPMDLDEVQARITTGRYAGGADSSFDVEAFANDVRLVWQNALDFNGGEGTNFGVIAKLLQQAFDRRLIAIKEAPRPVERATSQAPASRKRRRELHDACAGVAGNLSVASDIVDAIERACPAAVTRIPGATGTEADVDLDKLDDSFVEELLEQVLEQVQRR